MFHVQSCMIFVHGTLSVGLLSALEA